MNFEIISNILLNLMYFFMKNTLKSYKKFYYCFGTEKNI